LYPVDTSRPAEGYDIDESVKDTLDALPTRGAADAGDGAAGNQRDTAPNGKSDNASNLKKRR
jgi:hypothetical protein